MATHHTSMKNRLPTFRRDIEMKLPDQGDPIHIDDLRIKLHLRTSNLLENFSTNEPTK